MLAWYEAEGEKRPHSPSPDNRDKGGHRRSNEGTSQYHCDDMAVELNRKLVHWIIDKQPHKRLQKRRCGGGESEHGRAGGSEETRAKSQKGSLF